MKIGEIIIIFYIGLLGIVGSDSRVNFLFRNSPSFYIYRLLSKCICPRDLVNTQKKELRSPDIDVIKAV